MLGKDEAKEVVGIEFGSEVYRRCNGAILAVRRWCTAMWSPDTGGMEGAILLERRKKESGTWTVNHGIYFNAVNS